MLIGKSKNCARQVEAFVIFPRRTSWTKPFGAISGQAVNIADLLLGSFHPFHLLRMLSCLPDRHSLSPVWCLRIVSSNTAAWWPASSAETIFVWLDRFLSFSCCRRLVYPVSNESWSRDHGAGCGASCSLGSISSCRECFLENVNFFQFQMLGSVHSRHGKIVDLTDLGADVRWIRRHDGCITFQVLCLSNIRRSRLR